MHAKRLLPALLCLCALPGLAAAADLNQQIASGKWAMTFQRSGEIKPLHYKRNESGTSHTCIAGDARDKIVQWVSSKGCQIERETQTDGVYRLEGQCRLKWLKNQAIPVSVELRPESATRFSLDIRTRENALLGFTEHTTARLEGACDPSSAGQPKQHQGTKT